MIIRAALLLPVLLAACSAESSPEAQCERQSIDDPAVQTIYTRTDGEYTKPGTVHDDLVAAKRQAVLRCMRAKGLAPPGGVQTVQPR